MRHNRNHPPTFSDAQLVFIAGVLLSITLICSGTALLLCGNGFGAYLYLAALAPLVGAFL